jgi:monoamine oxidase
LVLEDGRPLRVNGDEGYDPGDLEEYGAALAALDRATAGIPLDRPWAAPEAHTLDAMTLETWLDGHVERPGARTMLATTVANLFAAEPASLFLSTCSSTSAPAAAGRRSRTRKAERSRTASWAASKSRP